MKQEAFFRRLFCNKSTSVVDNVRGQAVIEYILLLVIIVSLVLGMRGVFSSMNTFMSDIIGGYVSCLMEYGELPALGVEDTDLKNHKDGSGKRCPVPNFSAVASFSGTSGGTGGSGPSSGPGSGNGYNNGNGRNGSNNGQGGAGNNGSGSNRGSGGDSSEVSSGGSGSGSRSSVRGRARNSSPYSRGQMSRAGSSSSTADNPEDLNSNSKMKSIAEAGTEDDSGSWGSGGRRGSRRATPVNPKYKAISGRMAEDIQKNARVTRKPGSTLLATEEGYRLTALKRTVNPPEAKPPAEEKPEESFSFGNFLKWLIIAGILIACFILFGGQVMNYSNSDS